MCKAFSVLFLLPLVAIMGCGSRRAAEMTPVEARRLFIASAKAGFPDDAHSRYDEACKVCFRAGNRVDEYADVFKTAHGVSRENPRYTDGAHTRYAWGLGGGPGEGEMVLFVLVGKDPPVVLRWWVGIITE